MEWAVGKQGEIMRPNTGKLMLPGSKIRWDIHYTRSVKTITDDVELGHLLLPEGPGAEVPHVLALYSGVTGGNRNLDIPPNSISVDQNFHVMRKAGRVENFQPHMHLRGKAMMVEAILPNGTQQVLSYVPNFEFNWMNNYVLADDYGAAAAEGHDPQSRRGTTTPRRRRATPTRTSGSAGAIARSTKWRTRGSTSPT